MNHSYCMRSVMLGIVCWGAALSAAQGATPVAASASAPAASASAPAPQRTRPLPSPAVRAAQGAATPGDLRPENPVVPQIAVPLRRDRAAAGGARAGSAAGGDIDDSAARCRAATSERERAACARNGSLPGALQKR